MDTSMPEFGSLESQEVREYWADEARDFTPWIADEVRSEDESELEDALGLELEVIKEKKGVGRYNVDILAEVVDDNRNVVIENQLNSSDHDHLGKTCSACGTKDGNQRVERGLYVCEECDTVANADMNGAENIRRKVTPSPSEDRSNGWLAQPSVHLFDRNEGCFVPREQVVDCKP
ncbi:Putative transposase DNA-binding domain-containing protein [Natronorubrum thiooxidans]|uniref:Putative transposase DNA-binding domain-containing protein n=1 Tax=Natronorubrum thiooxidans TaxID=308853 RepID=A0A1N7H486_9EURY|nr:Putative transposase DNA-binding domain-containing protein [Natronorubrum thiooxidans]